MLNLLIPVVSGIISKIIDKTIPDKEKALEMKAQALEAVHNEGRAELEGAMKIILAEAQGGWLQRNWRPMLMLWFAGLVGAHWFGFTPENLSPKEVNMLLEIVKIGIGGYVIGRSVEKGIKEWKK